MFIKHSMGGILMLLPAECWSRYISTFTYMWQALLQCKNRAQYKQIFDSTRAIISSKISPNGLEAEDPRSMAAEISESRPKFVKSLKLSQYTHRVYYESLR
jgi:outer membrane receptor for Fe3+-dicitrate